MVAVLHLHLPRLELPLRGEREHDFVFAGGGKADLRHRTCAAGDEDGVALEFHLFHDENRPSARRVFELYLGHDGFIGRADFGTEDFQEQAVGFIPVVVGFDALDEAAQKVEEARLVFGSDGGEC